MNASNCRTLEQFSGKVFNRSATICPYRTWSARSKRMARTPLAPGSLGWLIPRSSNRTVAGGDSAGYRGARQDSDDGDEHANFEDCFTWPMNQVTPPSTL